MLDSKFWKQYFEVYDILNEVIPYQELMQDITEALEVKKGDKILDAGSGTGNLAVILEKKGAKVVGIDFSPEGVARHKKKIPNAEVYVRDITEPLPFEDESFDKVVSNNVLYSISRNKRSEVVKEFYRVLKPKGRVVVSNITINFKPISIYKDHLQKDIRNKGLLKTLYRMVKFIIPTAKMFFYNRKIIKENSFGAYNFFEANEQEKIIEKTGFKIFITDKKVYAYQGDLVAGEK